MQARFEDDLIEIARDGNYVMLCADRQMLFLDGAAAGKVPLADVASFEADGAAITVQVAEGDAHVQPFPSAPSDFAIAAAAKLSAAAGAWRGRGRGR